MELQVIHTHSVYLDELHPKPLFCKLSAFKRINHIGQMWEINRCLKGTPMKKNGTKSNNNSESNNRTLYEFA